MVGNEVGVDVKKEEGVRVGTDVVGSIVGSDVGPRVGNNVGGAVSVGAKVGSEEDLYPHQSSFHQSSDHHCRFSSISVNQIGTYTCKIL